MYFSVKVSVIGSREQLCIHEHVRKEMSNANKVHVQQNMKFYHYDALDGIIIISGLEYMVNMVS